MPADEAFDSAERLERDINPAIEHLYSLRGIQHADDLRRRGDHERARRVTDANRAICDRKHWPDDLSGCHRVLGDLDTVDGQPERARDNYQTALKLARSISRLDVLIQALSAYGRFLARHGEDATGVLNEALRLARNGGYRLYEVDVRVGLAWASLQTNESAAARREAGQAQRMSTDMGYAWGREDADEVLAAIAQKFGEQPT
jgi:tetratricopeptide (TPR) repeat protein